MFGGRIWGTSLDYKGSDFISGLIHCVDYMEVEEPVGDSASLGKDQH